MNIWLERLTSLYRSQVRQFASQEGLQAVHIEILQYLSMCNRYSNTAQALSEYLGLTKGSISQSLKVLEKDAYIERRSCLSDKRITRLHLTAKAQASITRISSNLLPDSGASDNTTQAIKSLIREWQIKNEHQGFGQCRSCQFNQSQGDGQFTCGLTGEALAEAEVQQLCREHRFSDQ